MPQKRETDQLNVWCKVCGELVAEVKVIHATKPIGFRSGRRKQMLMKISAQIEKWKQHIIPIGESTSPTRVTIENNLLLLGKIEGSQFVMDTIQGLFRDYELTGVLKG